MKGLISLVLIGISAVAQGSLETTWRDIVKQESNNNLNLSDQAFCYIDPKGDLAGENITKPLSIASVSKLFSTFWALQKYGRDHVFETKFYLNGKNMHIAGSKDPIFARRNLYFLITKLNEMGYEEFNNITYDQDFYAVPQAIDNSSHASVFDGSDGVHYCKQYEPTTGEMAPILKRYLNTDQWGVEKVRHSLSDTDSSGLKCIIGLPRTVKEDYSEKKSQLAELSANPKMKVTGSISYEQSNPYIKNGKVLTGTKVLTIKSVPLENIIKYTNVRSANLPADALFASLGGAKQFKKDFAKVLAVIDPTSSLDFFGGSGIPFKTVKNGIWTRKENKADCQTVLTIMEMIHRETNGQWDDFFDLFEFPSRLLHDEISSNVVAVGGVEGTVYNRFKDTFPRSLIAKTGTLSSSSALSGTLETSQGKVHFAVINNFPIANSSQYTVFARNIQNRMVSEMFKEKARNTFSYQAKFSTAQATFRSYSQNVEIQSY